MMNRQQLVGLIALLFWMGAVLPGCVSAEDVHLNGKLQKNDLGIDLDDQYGFAMDKVPTAKLQAVVTKVRLGSSAYYHGLKAGDHVLSCKLEKTTISLVLQRDGKTYGVQLQADQNADMKALRAKIAEQLDQTHLSTHTHKDHRAPIVTIGPDDQFDKLLHSYEVVVVIDKTGSMHDPIGPSGISKWQWCCDQIVGLMSQSHLPINEVTVVPFNESFQVIRHANLHTVEDVYLKTNPEGFTNTYAPLEDRLSNYFHEKGAGTHPQPLLMAVLTDGLPNRPDSPALAKKLIREAIINATKRMTDPSEIAITFLQIGSDFQGGDFLKELDDELPLEGAKYDIVDTKSFPELRQIGLRQALIDALREKKTTPALAKQAELQGLIKDVRSSSHSTAAVDAKLGLLNQASAGVDAINRSLGQQLQKIRSEAEDDIAQVPRRIFSGKYSMPNSDYDSRVAQIVAERDDKIDRLKREAEEKKQSLMSDAQKRCAGWDSAAQSSNGPQALPNAPPGTNHYVHNYITHGADAEPEVDPLRATAQHYSGHPQTTTAPGDQPAKQ